MNVEIPADIGNSIISGIQFITNIIAFFNLQKTMFEILMTNSLVLVIFVAIGLFLIGMLSKFFGHIISFTIVVFIIDWFLFLPWISKLLVNT